MKVYVEKADGGFWCVVVPREATVHDLKKALKNHVALMLVGNIFCYCMIYSQARQKAAECVDDSGCESKQKILLLTWYR